MAQRVPQQWAAMLFCGLHSAAATDARTLSYDVSISSSKFDIQRQSIELTFEDGHTIICDACWLADNCTSGKQIGTSQKIRNAPDRQIQNYRVDDAHLNLEIMWREDAVTQNIHKAPRSPTIFSAAWLRQLAPSRQTSSLGPHSLERVMASCLPTIAWEEVINSDDGLRYWVQNLVDHGICLLRGVPTNAASGTSEISAVERAAALIGPIQPTMYGSMFEVRSEAQPINIAYSEAALPLHMDLAYLESPPGLQLLHCLQPAAEGGASLFLDAHAAANILRREHPQAFAALCRIPATFQKDHAARADPAKYFYRRPHIHTNNSDEGCIVSAVFWSPPFEGPLLTRHPDEVQEYYHAYRLFAGLVEDQKSDLRLAVTLQKGDLISWNQRRILHGRSAFQSTVGGSTGPPRHLQGCYVNIDDFLSKYRVLMSRAHGDEAYGVASTFVVGNRSEFL